MDREKLSCPGSRNPSSLIRISDAPEGCPHPCHALASEINHGGGSRWTVRRLNSPPTPEKVRGFDRLHALVQALQSACDEMALLRHPMNRHYGSMSLPGDFQADTNLTNNLFCRGQSLPSDRGIIEVDRAPLQQVLPHRGQPLT
jgi:hypothetical protein